MIEVNNYGYKKMGLIIITWTSSYYIVKIILWINIITDIVFFGNLEKMAMSGQFIKLFLRRVENKKRSKCYQCSWGLITDYFWI